MSNSVVHAREMDRVHRLQEENKRLRDELDKAHDVLRELARQIGATLEKIQSQK